MTLRTRLFLLVGGLAVVLVVAQWFLVRTLSRDVASEVGQVAFRVGEGVATSLGMLRGTPPAGGGSATFELPMPGPGPGSHVVTEREIRLQEKDGKLEIVDEQVRVGRVSSEGVALAPGGAEVPGARAHAPATATTAQVFVMLSVDSKDRADFLRLGGPDAERHVPIPRAGVEDALDAFRRRLLAGSATLLAAGLALAALIAHRATAPLRELSAAARAVGGGALGTQVPHGGPGEVGEAVAAFNVMSARLAELDAESKRLREREHLTEVGEIARGLAHGLRNPLNALGLTVDELASDGPDRATLADAARRQIRRIDASVRSFLALAASAGAAPETDVDLVALVQDVALEALQDARGRVGIGVEAEPSVPAVRGVPAELRAVAQALVVNAAEASPDGGRVVVRVQRCEDGGARVVVDDEGPGLPESVQQRLFTPHVTTKPNGSGMGLYLAHRIVTARQGGTLELLPRAEGGTRAVATFPPAPEGDPA